MSLEFEIIENQLQRNEDIKYLKLKNDIYDIVVYYYGDYEGDRTSGGLLLPFTSVTCSRDGVRPEIKYAHGHIYIAIENEWLRIPQVDKYKTFLDDAKASCIALQNIMRDYDFPVYILDE